MNESPSLNQNFNPEESTRAVYKSWRDGFVTPLLVGSLVLGLFALIPAVRSAQSSVIGSIFIAAYLIAGLVTFIRFPYSVKMSVFLLLVYVLGLSELASNGILGDSLFFFFVVVILATMMFSPRVGIFVAAADILTFVVFGLLTLNGQISPINPHAIPATALDWISAGAVIVMFGTVIIVGFQRLGSEFFDAQKQIDTTLNALKDERNNLDNKVQDRTRQLRSVNEIGRAVTSILDPDELLTRASQLIGDEFESYYVAIYLLDASGQWAEIKEATGEAGKVLRENRHRVDLNGKSIVAQTINSRQVYIAADSADGPARFDNPLFPYTRSQVVIPLVIGERVLGAMELHSTKKDAFSHQDVDTYQNMSNEVAVALENSRLFREAQQSLVEMRATQRQYLQSAWFSATSEKELRYEIGDTDAPGTEIQVPLALRDQIIGQIQMISGEEWTSEQKNLVESIASQAALALENARLVEESQSIAARERLANEIISKVWASNTVDAILQTTVRELGRALDVTEAVIELDANQPREAGTKDKTK